jgi:DNA-directed RNA polymerase specialized sigma24 family protein
MQQSEQPVGMEFALYDCCAPSILAFFRQHISNPQDAEDLLVEVFLAALSRPNFSALAAEHQQAWLRRVAV